MRKIIITIEVPDDVVLEGELLASALDRQLVAMLPDDADYDVSLSLG